jgi:hypothetical protein
MATKEQLQKLYSELMALPFLDSEQAYMLRQTAKRLGITLKWEHVMLDDLAGREDGEQIPWQEGLAPAAGKMDVYWANLRADKRRRAQKARQGRQNGYRRTRSR